MKGKLNIAALPMTLSMALTMALTILFFLCYSGFSLAADYHIAVSGNDDSGDGSQANPWATITKALESVPDGSRVLVHAGTYNGRIRLRGNFSTGVTVKSQPLYQAKLRNDDTVITSYSNNIRGITIEGFDIAHSGSGAGALVVHLDGGGSGQVSNITIKNNILHDSYDNDILKINNAATHIVVTGNVFYNQTGSDEHIDINSVDNVTVQDNIFFNDFEGSGRNNGNNTSSFIVIKDSNGSSDSFTGSSNVRVGRNIFLNWQGSTGSNFVLIGEDGNPYFEGVNITVENNLLLGNSGNVMRSPFGVKGGKDIVFRNNTISGDMPSYAYGMRLNTEGANPPNQNIQFYNNLWSDQTGTMGARSSSDRNDFSDTDPDQTSSFVLNNNLYWNGGAALPEDSDELINPSDDSAAVTGNPGLTAPVGVTLPRWNEARGEFGGGHATIRAAFSSLALKYCGLSKTSKARDRARADQTPAVDLLGTARPFGNGGDIGACEYSTTPGDGGEGGGATIPSLHLLMGSKP